jgi:hypothetical protein
MRQPMTRWYILALTPLIVLSLVRTGGADPIQYSTGGDVGNSVGVPIGNFAIQYMNSTLMTPGSFTVASFQAEALPNGASLTYTNMPFYVDVEFKSPQQSSNGFSEEAFLNIQGVLNGTVTGSTSSNVEATVTSTSLQFTGPNFLPFSASSITFLTPQTLAPSGINRGITPLIAQIALASPLPEPTPLVMMEVLAGWAAFRLVRRRIRRRESPPEA